MPGKELVKPAASTTTTFSLSLQSLMKLMEVQWLQLELFLYEPHLYTFSTTQFLKPFGLHINLQAWHINSTDCYD